MSELKEYMNKRDNLNELTFKYANLGIKRFFNLDNSAYKDGKIDRKIKEMLGFVASLVLRCDDCIKYHLYDLYKLNVSDEELVEIVEIGLVVGGSIVIPHVRKIFDWWEEIKSENR